MRIPTSSFGALLPAPSSRWPAVILAGLFCGAMAEAYLIPEPPSSNDAAVQVPVIQGTTEVQQVRYAQSNSGALVGYSAPIRMARVASAEAGVVRALVVTEGSSVRAGQTLAQLDDREWIASRDVAVAARDAHGELDEARAELELRTGRLAALERLGLAGHSNPEELRRAEFDHRLANSRYEAALESQQQRAAEVARLDVKLASCQISAPFAGIISEVLKQPGEYVGPTDPAVMTLVDVSRLEVVLLLATDLAQQFEVGQSASVHFQHANQFRPGVVSFVAPVLHSESGTITVKVTVDNSEGQLMAGDTCTVTLGTKPNDDRTASRPAAIDTAR